MKNRKITWTIIVITFLVFFNIPNFILRELAILLGEGKFIETGSDIYCITKDRKFPTGYLNVWNEHNSQSYYYYSAYRKTYPEADTTLYRVSPILLYRFWRWGEYIVHPYWHQPYLKMSNVEWNKIQKQMWNNDRKYGNPFPKDTLLSKN